MSIKANGLILIHGHIALKKCCPSRRKVIRRTRAQAHKLALFSLELKDAEAADARTVWQSGLRRWLQAPIRKDVCSNPTAVSGVLERVRWGDP